MCFGVYQSALYGYAYTSGMFTSNFIIPSYGLHQGQAGKLFFWFCYLAYFPTVFLSSVPNAMCQKCALGQEGWGYNI